jgi:glycerol-3-phosphate dehydrogenase
MAPAPALDALAREATLDRLDREAFDCAVIGGGITCAGIAREAAMRGLSVALLEACDFASGTSSRSSKLIHGGLRYLAMGDVALVRSSALERKVLHRLAPHLAQPRWLVVPARSWAGLLKLRAGITTYEKLGAVESRDRHQRWSRKEMEEHEPLLDRERYGFACAYREYLTDDARLVLANLRDAAAHGAVATNHARVVAVTARDGAADGVEAVCALTGRRVRVRARCVVNAAGPWVDAVRLLEDPEAPVRLHLSKGVHVTVSAERLPIRNMLILATEDRRSIFVIRRGPAVYVGTTDTTYEPGVETWPEICREDVTYLLAPLARDLAGEPLVPEDVVAAWAGLRPLIAEPGKGPTEISRKDEVWIGPKRVVTIAGGKLTGYRPMAQLTLAKAAEACGLAPAPPREEERPLPGGDFEGGLGAVADALARQHGLPPACAERLASLYGSEASRVLGAGKALLVPDALVVEGEVDFGVRHEGALRLEDVIYRRTRAALYEVSGREALLEPVAARMAGLLGWSDARRSEEIARTRDLLRRELAFARQEPARKTGRG